MGRSSPLGQLTEIRLSTAVRPTLSAQGKATHFCPPTGAPCAFSPQPTRSYLRAGTEPYLLRIPQFKPLDTPAKASSIHL